MRFIIKVIGQWFSEDHQQHKFEDIVVVDRENASRLALSIRVPLDKLTSRLVEIFEPDQDRCIFDSEELYGIFDSMVQFLRDREIGRLNSLVLIAYIMNASAK